MRILFFIPSLDRSGGTERVCSVIASAFAERAGYTVGIVSMFSGLSPFFEINLSISVYSLFKSKHRFKYIVPVTIFRLRRLLNIFHPDLLINVNIDSTLCWYSVPARWRTNTSNITWEHLNLNMNLLSRRIARALAARWADAVVTLTERDLVNWHERFRPRALIVAIPNPCSYTCRAEPYREDSHIVLAAGHLTHRKGFDLLIRAWGAIPAVVRRDWRLRLVGSGEEEHALTDLVASLSIADSVNFVGRKEDMAEEYTGAGLFVLSSRKEGLPMVLLEAMSFGLPVVAFDCETGPAEIVVDGQTGLLTAPEDVPALSKAMSRMMSDSQFRSECARRALRRASDYSIERVLEKWEVLFDALRTKSHPED